MLFPTLGCGGEVSERAGEITSPRFPLEYPRDVTCEWTAKVEEGKYLALNFDSFEVESRCDEPGCECLDYVEITEYDHKKNPQRTQR